MSSDDMVLDQPESSEETAAEGPNADAPVETALSVDTLDESEYPEVSPAEGEEPEAASEEEKEALEAVVEETAQPEELSDEEMFLAALEADSPDSAVLDDFMLHTLRRGQVVEGTIVRITPTEIMVDVGAKSEGIVTGREMETLPRDLLDSLEVGQSILVYVRSPEDRNGNILLSLSRAMEEQDWRSAENYLQSREVYHGKITGFNKGGLIIRFGRLRGFLPASQVTAERRRRSNGATPEERWGDMVGEDIAAKVIEVERARNRLILSERAAEREMRAIRRQELLATLEVGQVRQGWVISLADFGAFVDLGGADGLVHLSELSWKHITHPREVLKVGDEVRVEVISVDRENQRIGLSIKRQLPDPWNEIAAKYEVGQLVQGTVTKLTKFGAFARLVEDPEIEGLIHVSELVEHRVGHPREVVQEGDVVTLRIVRIDPERRRVGLSMKRVDSEEYLEQDWRSALSAANEESAPEAEVVEEAVAEPEAEAPEVEPEAVEEAVAEAESEIEAPEAEAAEAVEEVVAEAESEIEAPEAESEVVEEMAAEAEAEAPEAEPEVVGEMAAEAEAEAPEVEPEAVEEAAAEAESEVEAENEEALLAESEPEEAAESEAEAEAEAEDESEEE
jgi:small subunit ribosomal protein S1